MERLTNDLFKPLIQTESERLVGGRDNTCSGVVPFIAFTAPAAAVKL
jgi:hypothetical protein